MKKHKELYKESYNCSSFYIFLDELHKQCAETVERNLRDRIRRDCSTEELVYDIIKWMMGEFKNHEKT